MKACAKFGGFFPGENFLNFRQDCQEEARQGVGHVEDVFDTIGSGKFKVPFPLGRLGRNVKIQPGTGTL